MKENTKNEKRKERKNTLAKYLSTRIVLATIIGIIVYIIIYLFFCVKGVIPCGDGLDKTDWLSFLGAYLSFFGTVKMKEVVIPSFVVTIGQNPFLECSSLEMIYVVSNNNNYISIEG